jgi:ribulose-phosphate 3-epimerase
MDGKFVPNKTIQIEDLRKIKTKLDIQIHLMAKNPEEYIPDYAQLGAKEFIFHAEATNAAKAIVEHIQRTGMKAGVALNPETSVRSALDALKVADIALVMTVHPGRQAQIFLKDPLKKIPQVKQLNKNIIVGVDGGVHLDTCRYAVAAGADFLVSGSAIWKSDPKKAFEKLHACTRQPL